MLMKFFWIIALSSGLLLSWTHPLKLSVSEMKLEPNAPVIIETRLFLDDLTAHIAQTYRLRKPTFLSLQSEGTKALQRYIRQRFYLVQSGKPNHLNIIHTRLSDDKLALVVSLRSERALQAKSSFKVKNSLFFDVFKKQKNLLNISGVRRGAHAFRVGKPWRSF